jgi:hypothetical protein
MVGETPQSVIDRIDQIERRLKEVENPSPGWVTRISRVGIIVACIGGILGGASTSLNLWECATATPNLDIVLGDCLHMYWSSENRLLSLACGVTLQNKGGAIGVVKTAHAHVESKEGTGKQQRLDDIQVIEKRDKIPFPVSIRPHDARDLEITMASNLTHEAEQTFFEEGLYNLFLEIIEKPQPIQREYCIYMGQSLLRDLREKGYGKIDTPDVRCKLGNP